MKKTPTHAELDTILGKTRAELDAILATVDVALPALLGEDIDIAASITAMGLDTPISEADIEAMLGASSAPARPAASTPLPPPIPTTGSVKISIRIPGRILATIKARATATGKPYQRVLNQVLRDAVRGWEATAGKTAL